MNAAAAINRHSLRALVQSADCRLPIDGIGPKAALVALTRLFDDRTGQSQGSNVTIGKLMGGISKEQAGRYIAALCAVRIGGRALVSKIARPGVTNAYVIHLDVLASLDDCKPTRSAVDNSVSTPVIEGADPCHISGVPLSYMPATPVMDDNRTVKGTVSTTEEGTEARVGNAVDSVTFHPLPIFEDLKTEQPWTAVDDVLAGIADKRAEGLPIGGQQIRDLIEAADASGEVPLAVAADAVRGCLTAVEAPAAPAPAAPAAPAIHSPAAPAAAPAFAVAIAPDTLAAVNAQRVRNGKTAFKPADLRDLHREATLAGMAPQAAAEWILAKPGRNFFRADFYRPEPTASAAPAAPTGPVELTAAGRAAQAQIARALAAPAAVPAKPAAASLVASPSARPISAAVTLRHAAPTALGSTGTGWARQAVDSFLAGQPVSHVKLTNAAAALGLAVRDIKAQRAATLAPVAA